MPDGNLPKEVHWVWGSLGSPSAQGLSLEESPQPRFLVWVWLGGGGWATTEFLGGVPALLRGSGPCLGPKECGDERGGSGFLLGGHAVYPRACLRGVLSRGCWDLVSGETEVSSPFSPGG